MRAANEGEVLDYVRAARADRTAFEIVAGATKRGFGQPMDLAERLDVSALSGIRVYEPEELILTVLPATPIADIKAMLAEKGQQLGFDPPEWAKLFGAEGASTIGGVVSADASGSARLRHGAARDQLLGISAVNGFGEHFKAGGRVVKNVTGFDIPKLICGAMGSLGVLTELTFRIYPKPAGSLTFALCGTPPEKAFAMLRRVWASALEPTGLAYIPSGVPFAGLDESAGTALIRLAGAPVPLAEKASALRERLAGHDVRVVEEGDALFEDIAAGAPFVQSDLDIWRIAVPPSEAARVSAALAAPLWYADWAGGMLWAGFSSMDHVRLRAIVAEAGGHATLLRADEQTRRDVGAFPPQPSELAALTRSVKAAFDPLGLFNPGRI